MIMHNNINLLVQSLLKLSNKLGLSLFEIRKDFFHRFTQNKPHDIHRTISKHINKIAKKAESQPQAIQSQEHLVIDSPLRPKDYTELSDDSKNGETNHEHFVSTGIHTHVDHYKFKTSSECNPAIKEQLAKNTWTHIHAAIRNARQGKKTEAKLYGELANNALKEAAHYMTEEEYLKFTSSIDLELNRLEQG